MSVLVSYASKHGSTEEIAERIAARPRQTGKEVDVRPVRHAADLDLKSYEAVVIGSAVYYGSWMKEATEFVRANSDVLAARPVWLFSSGPTGDSVQSDPKPITELKAAVRARDHQMFGGELDHHKLLFPERVIVKGVKAPEGDYRDWDMIDAWAENIGRALAPAAHPARFLPSQRNRG